jgi:carbon-monoxide dehydrogenase large subunit
MGSSVRRKEDQRLLTGQGKFSDDASRPNEAFAAMVRSPHAHARINNMDKTRALAAPGVIDVLTGADFVADGLNRIPHVANHSSPPDIVLTNKDGSPVFEPDQFPMPIDRTRHVGEVVAFVLAETKGQARDAAELVDIDYEPLPAVTDTWQAADDNAPLVWDETARNVCVDAEVGERQAVEEAFAFAHHVAHLKTTIARVAGVPMEPRSAFGIYNAAEDSYLVYAGSGGVVRHKREIASVLGVEQDQVRVIAGDVGGNFGTRNPLYVEIPLVAWASKRIGRPVKWNGDRTESFLTDCQARDLAVDAEMAFDSDGNILALRSLNIGNLGAYTISFIPVTKGVEIMNITYRIPRVFVRAQAVHSNTPPTYPYRSAGRPEVHYVMERLLDKAADGMGMDRIELRRRNMVTQEEFPYENRLGLTYDCGDFIGNMDIALRISDWAGFAARRAASEAHGKLRGIGVSNYIDLSTGVPVERTEIDVKPEGEIEVVMGTGDSGQGHETSFAQVVSEELQATFDSIQVIQGDTLRVKAGGGTHSGRSMRMGAMVISQAVDEIVDKGKKIASVVLEAADTDISYENGHFRVAGTDRTVSLFEVAAAARDRDDLPEDLKGRLGADAEIEFRRAVFGNGTQVVEVEIDPETGVTRLDRYTAVDDVGNAINPLLIHGQTHGGIAQGAGQALMEACSYDPESGQMRAATFMDYAIPRATDFPFFNTEITEIPSPTNRLGIKPGSEGGTAPAPAVIANAVVDALSELGVNHVELPLTSQRVWQAIQQAQG